MPFFLHFRVCLSMGLFGQQHAPFAQRSQNRHESVPPHPSLSRSCTPPHSRLSACLPRATRLAPRAAPAFHAARRSARSRQAERVQLLRPLVVGQIGRHDREGLRAAHQERLSGRGQLFRAVMVEGRAATASVLARCRPRSFNSRLPSAGSSQRTQRRQDTKTMEPLCVLATIESCIGRHSMLDIRHCLSTSGR
jgi:hypothetical protein